MGHRPDSASYQYNIVIGMLTAGMMKKQVAQHFQACECMISGHRTKFCQKGSFKSRHHIDRPHYPTRKEEIDNVTSCRCNPFLSSRRSPDLVRNTMGIPICDKTVQRGLYFLEVVYDYADVAHTLVFSNC